MPRFTQEIISQIKDILEKPNITIIQSHVYQDDSLYTVWQECDKLMEVYIMPLTNNLAHYTLLVGDKKFKHFIRANAVFRPRKARDILDAYANLRLRQTIQNSRRRL